MKIFETKAKVNSGFENTKIINSSVPTSVHCTDL
jgi:hypothetical protein